jgi:hypothetical protein
VPNVKRVNPSRWHCILVGRVWWVSRSQTYLEHRCLVNYVTTSLHSKLTHCAEQANSPLTQPPPRPSEFHFRGCLWFCSFFSHLRMTRQGRAVLSLVSK